MLNFASISQAAIQSFLNFAQRTTLGYGDVLDIAIVAILIFFVLTLFKKTRSMPILFGILLLVFLYAISTFLQLRLTQTIFNALFGILLIIIAIIFQKELRRFFELIGVIGLKRKFYTPSETIFKTITRAVEYLAEHKMGAIIVFPGTENIYRHLEGGIKLEGKVSRPLILSLFDSSSPGHDGAIIIEKDMIKKFAVHLPFAENTEAVRRYGTRHRAALGLAEVTDAFVVIVSEERGTISIASNKRFKTISNISELEELLHNFFETKFSQKGFRNFKKWLKENIWTLLSSIAIASSLWLLFTYQASVIQRKYTLPLQFKGLNPEYVVEDYNPEDIVIAFSGRESDFKLIENQLPKISVDLSGVDLGWHNVIIKKDFIPFPSVLTLVKIEPEIVKVRLVMLRPNN